MKRTSPHAGAVLTSALAIAFSSATYAASVNEEPASSTPEPTRRTLPLKNKAAPAQTPAEESATPPRSKTTLPRVAPATTAPKATTTVPTAPTKAAPDRQRSSTVVKPDATRTGTKTAPSAKETVLQLLAPNGGENLQPGSRLTIQWRASGLRGPGVIELHRNGRKVDDIARSVNLAAGTTTWRIPRKLAAGEYSVLIKSRDGKHADSSDQVFTIGAAAGAIAAGKATTPDSGDAAAATGASGGTTDGTTAAPAPSLSFLSPTTNTGWCTNSAHEFRWNSTLPAGNTVSIELLRSDGTTLWQNIASNTPDDGSYDWPGLTDAQFSSGSITLRPRIRSSDNSVVTIGEMMHFGKPLMLNTPQSNHTWRKGSQYTIRWTQLCDLPAPITLELLDASQQPLLSIAEGLPSAGHHMPRWLEWTVPTNLNAGTYHIRVRTADGQLTRSGSFKIAEPVSITTSGALTFTSPTTDAAWCTNEAHEFHWNTTLPAGTAVKLDLMDGNGETVWRSLASNLPNSGSYVWPGLSDAQFGFNMGTFRPRIATMDNSEVTVGGFLHFGKRLMLDAPKSNYTWRKGSAYEIRWTQLCTLPAAVEIELLDANHQSVATLASGLAATGSSSRRSLPWTVPASLAAGTYYVRVRSADQQYVQESTFTIADPTP